MQIKNIRKQKGITQTELATLLNINQTTISKWETGKTVPSIRTIKELAKIFGCAVEELI